jgi:hypothetical protein
MAASLSLTAAVRARTSPMRAKASAGDFSAAKGSVDKESAHTHGARHSHDTRAM